MMGIADIVWLLRIDELRSVSHLLISTKIASIKNISAIA